MGKHYQSKAVPLNFIPLKPPSLYHPMALGEAQVDQAVEQTKEKIRRRLEVFRGDSPPPDLSAAEVVVVDDGLASGVTMAAAIRALFSAGAAGVTVAVPTAHEQSIERIRHEVSAVYCANIRGGRQYAVADAYRSWRDVPEDQAVQIFRQYLRDYRAGPP